MCWIAELHRFLTQVHEGRKQMRHETMVIKFQNGVRVLCAVVAEAGCTVRRSERRGSQPETASSGGWERIPFHRPEGSGGPGLPSLQTGSARGRAVRPSGHLQSPVPGWALSRLRGCWSKA